MKCFLFSICLLSLFTGTVAFGAEDLSLVEQGADSSWLPVIKQILSLVFQVCTPIFLMVSVYVAKKLAAKWDVELTESHEIILNGLVKKGVNWADAWAKLQTEKPLKQTKLQTAVGFITAELKGSKLPAVARERLVALVEAQLCFDTKIRINKEANE